MDAFKSYLQKQGLTGRSLVTMPSAVRSIMKRFETDNPVIFVSKREEVKKLLTGNTYSPATVNGYVMAIKHCIRWMDIGKDKTEENLMFYNKIGAESMSAHKTAKNPNRQIRPRGIRADEALEKFHKDLIAAKERNDAEEIASGQAPSYITQTGVVRKARLNIPKEAIENENRNIFERIDLFTPTIMSNKGLPIQKSTQKLYSGNIKLVIERYNKHRNFTGDANLDFIVSEPEKVIEWLDTLKINTRKALETAIVKYLALANATDEQRHEAYEKYTTWLKKQDPHPSSQKTEFLGYDYISGKDKTAYNWKLLLKNVDYILKNKNPNEVQKLFMLLFTRQPPRRSKDYTYMLVQETDDKVHNIYMPNKKRFVFNSYKNISKTGPQTIEIRDDGLVKALNDYIAKRPGQKYLFEKADGQPINKDDVQKIMRDNIGKKFKIPFGINSVRHLFATYVHLFKTPKEVEEFARLMGTSSKMLNLHYINVTQKEFDDDDNEKETVVHHTPAENDENLGLDRMFETKEERIRRQKNDSQRKLRALPKGKEQMRKDNEKRKDAKKEWAQSKRARTRRN